MTILFAIYLVILTIVLLLIMRADAISGRSSLFSTRNWFLAGLILFQSVSGATTLFIDQTEQRAELSYPVASSFAFCILLTLFVLLFLWSYRSSRWAANHAARKSVVRRTTLPRLVTAGVLLVGIGAALRFGGSGIPAVSVLLPQIAAGCLTGGCALIALAWARARFNVVIALILFAASALSAAALLVDAFGRRELIGLVFGISWALYLGKWRTLPIAWFLPRALAAASILFVIFTLFSGSREGGETVDRSLGSQIERIARVDPENIQENLIASAVGQFAGGISMWTIEQRALDGGGEFLHSLKYLVTMPIPRILWPEKPVGLGMILVDEAGVRGVAESHSWGPGLVGHFAHDFFPVALPLYAWILGAFFRYVDERVETSPGDPITLVMFGSALGQILGMARGDLGLFAWQMACAFAGVWIFGRLISAFVLPRDRNAEWELANDAGEDFDAESAPDLEPDPQPAFSHDHGVRPKFVGSGPS